MSLPLFPACSGIYLLLPLVQCVPLKPLDLQTTLSPPNSSISLQKLCGLQLPNDLRMVGVKDRGWKNENEWCNFFFPSPSCAHTIPFATVTARLFPVPALFTGLSLTAPENPTFSSVRDQSSKLTRADVREVTFLSSLLIRGDLPHCLAGGKCYGHFAFFFPLFFLLLVFPFRFSCESWVMYLLTHLGDFRWSRWCVCQSWEGLLPIGITHEESRDEMNLPWPL